MTDLQAALERLATLASTLDSDDPVTFRTDAAALRTLLTDHAALRAEADRERVRAEAAEGALRQSTADMSAVRGSLIRPDEQHAIAARVNANLAMLRAAHPQSKAPES